LTIGRLRRLKISLAYSIILPRTSPRQRNSIFPNLHSIAADVTLTLATEKVKWLDKRFTPTTGISLVELDSYFEGELCKRALDPLVIMDLRS